jgi:YHS domain-containing protein
MAIDPVCQMEVDEKNPAATAEYEGQTYYFCAPGCKVAFEKDPEKFVQAESGGEGHGGHGGYHHH